jgi:hypothetical protein
MAPRRGRSFGPQLRACPRAAGLSVIEIPVGAINSFSETRGLFAMVTGRGSVVLVASGTGNPHKVRMRDIDNPAAVVGAVRACGPWIGWRKG